LHIHLLHLTHFLHVFHFFFNGHSIFWLCRLLVIWNRFRLCCFYCLFDQCHSAFGAVTWLVHLHFRMHRTSIDNLCLFFLCLDTGCKKNKQNQLHGEE